MGVAASENRSGGSRKHRCGWWAYPRGPYTETPTDAALLGKRTQLVLEHWPQVAVTSEVPTGRMSMNIKCVSVLVFLASMTSAIAQTTGGSTSSPGAASPGAPSPSAGTRGVSPGAVAPPGTPNVTPNAGPNTPHPSTYSNHPGTMPQPAPNQEGQRAVPGQERAQPGPASSRPGAAQSANTDGYDECMAMWNPDTNRSSREDWSKTCDHTRLPPRR